MSAYDPEPRRGRTAVAVLLAVALLAVVGAVFGYLLGTRAKNQKAQAGASATAGAPTGKQCPTFIQQAANARGAALPLIQRLYIATKRQGAIDAADPYLSEVWICEAASSADGKSRLWYQGHKIKVARYPDEAVVNDTTAGNGILLNGVNAIDNGRYTATYADGKGNSTTYTVSSKELDVQQAAGTRTEAVVQVED